jgi:hypothetical protein
MELLDGAREQLNEVDQRLRVGARRRTRRAHLSGSRPIQSWLARDKTVTAVRPFCVHDWVVPTGEQKTGRFALTD